MPSCTAGEDSPMPCSVLYFHLSLPVCRSTARRWPDWHPTNTTPLAMAADDSIESPASNVQSSLSCAGTVAVVTPVRAGLPRNCGHSSEDWARATAAVRRIGSIDPGTIITTRPRVFARKLFRRYTVLFPMSMIQFTQNYDDLSTDRGYQFKFYCDRCHNGYLSSFQTSAIGLAGGLLRSASSLFGGVLGSASDSAYEVQRAVGGKAHDSALKAAVEEIKPQFHQCGRCGKWICPQVCFNAKRGLCIDCAPDVENEMAAAQAQATRD